MPFWHSMAAHYLAIALRSVRATPFASTVNLLTLSMGLVCFVTAYAFVIFWATAEQHFPKSRDVRVLTLTNLSRDGGPGRNNATTVPDIAAELLRADYPA